MVKLKVNSILNFSNQSYSNKNQSKNIQFEGHIFSFLPGKLKKFGKKFAETFNLEEVEKRFPFDTFIYKKGDSLVMNTPVMLSNGKIQPVITKLPISGADTKSSNYLFQMLNLNHQTAEIKIQNPIRLSSKN